MAHYSCCDRPLLLEHAIVSAGVDSNRRICAGQPPVSTEEVEAIVKEVRKLPAVLSAVDHHTPQGYIICKGAVEVAVETASSGLIPVRCAWADVVGWMWLVGWVWYGCGLPCGLSCGLPCVSAALMLGLVASVFGVAEGCCSSGLHAPAARSTQATTP